MAAFLSHRKPAPRRAPIRYIPIDPAFAYLPTAAHVSRVRDEPGVSAGTSLTVAFLIAGAVIVAALTFWSGPDGDRPEDTAVQEPAALAR